MLERQCTAEATTAPFGNVRRLARSYILVGRVTVYGLLTEPLGKSTVWSQKDSISSVFPRKNPVPCPR